MVATSTIATLVVASAASLFMAWAIGAGSSGSTPFAPAVGANAISVMRAGFFVGLLGLSGAVLQGANVTEAVGSELVVFPDGGSLSAIAAIVALLTAAVLVAVGIFTGYPIATAFTVTGAVVGVGLAMGGQPATAKYIEIVSLWVLTPFVGGGIAFGTAWSLRHEATTEERLVPLLGGLVGMILANIEFVLLAPGSEQVSVARAVARAADTPILPSMVVVTLLIGAVASGLLYLDMRADAAAGQRHFLLVMGGLVAFSAGGSQVGLALGPLVPLLGEGPTAAIPITGVLLFGGLGLLIGSWTGAPRMIKALAQDYSSLGPRRSIGALIPSFIIAQAAVFFGIPVSFNEIIVSAIVGSGAAAGGGEVSREKMGKTVLAWVGSLALAFGLSYGLFWIIDAAL
ncbi:inorganic phosphate transporter [Haloarcula sp. CBA1130]|uniref:inorganic phosphate transporter n=1 Tax=unclassified Haloarcula TaxID=2624677 RepID=UPI001244E48D|nr:MULTISPECIES: inorganic phosphate transporter [unclassified Haloarcula]KAA9399511.1 inorganic phosphate transporter [Haloarcula sp. CBA1129]KAA9401235.1 inorganic phosphate transporter [Haloarcula sp. CBA1130]